MDSPQLLVDNTFINAPIILERRLVTRIAHSSAMSLGCGPRTTSRLFDSAGFQRELDIQRLSSILRRWVCGLSVEHADVDLQCSTSFSVFRGALYPRQGPKLCHAQVEISEKQRKEGGSHRFSPRISSAFTSPLGHTRAPRKMHRRGIASWLCTAFFRLSFLLVFFLFVF